MIKNIITREKSRRVEPIKTGRRSSGKHTYARKAWKNGTDIRERMITFRIEKKITFNRRVVSIASSPRDLKRPKRKRGTPLAPFWIRQKNKKTEKAKRDFHSSCDYEVILRTYRFHMYETRKYIYIYIYIYIYVYIYICIHT